MPFQSQTEDGFHYIQCPEEIDQLSIEQLNALTSKWLQMSENIHVFNMQNVTFLSPQAYRPFVLFAQNLRKQNKQMVSIHLSKELYQQIDQDGLTSTFSPVKSLNEIKPPQHQKKLQLNVEFINPFIKAAQNALSVQADMTIESGKPYLKDQQEDDFQIGIAGVLQINSEEYQGSIILALPKEVFLGIYENMTDEKATEIDDETQDAAGELLNIIYGQAKAELNNEKGYTLNKAIPTVLSGEELKVKNLSRSSAIVLPFSSDLGTFRIEVTLDT